MQIVVYNARTKYNIAHGLNILGYCNSTFQARSQNFLEERFSILYSNTIWGGGDVHTSNIFQHPKHPLATRLVGTP